MATWLGGPHDGEVLALENPSLPVVMARRYRPTVGFHAESDPLPSPTIDTIKIRPELTRNGWVLRWPKGQS